jgi:hypothetical protein
VRADRVVEKGFTFLAKAEFFSINSRPPECVNVVSGAALKYDMYCIVDEIN